MRDTRFIVGVDLGTTNIAVSYVDTEADNAVRAFDIPQLGEFGEMASRSLFPSFCFFPDPRQTPEDGTALPWGERPPYVLGVFARDKGVAWPDRLIASAKSWLCHGGVNRRGRVLPWRGDPDKVAVSPLEVTSWYLSHLRAAWDYRFGQLKDRHGDGCALRDQQVVVTVPASFDETARELTLEAAEQAGLRGVLLLEEPLAAFYAWLNARGESWRDILKPGAKTLVMDVGGGTCDFSLIEMSESGSLSRTVSGNHLLLGGDNIDMALARALERSWGVSLGPADWTGLCQKAREAKERLLRDELKSVEVTLLSGGSSVIGGALAGTIFRHELLQVLLEGFFPVVPADAPSPSRKMGIQAMGLPYESDPELTRHLLEFLRRAATIAALGEGRLFQPDFVLFNGGAMIPSMVREQVLKTLGTWFEAPPVELIAEDLTLAVAVGAATYGLARRGKGVRVKSGAARAYYAQVSGDAEKPRYVCVMPRGVDENTVVSCPGAFSLETNRKARFPLFSAAVRTGDRAGDLVDTDEDLSAVSTLVSALRFGDADARPVAATLAAELTETGVLRLWLKSLESRHRWPLRFDTRLLEDTSPPTADAVVFDTARTAAAIALARRAFLEAPQTLPALFKTLETELALSRDSWPLGLLRDLADALLDWEDNAVETAEKEARYLNVLGFCLRPGFGDPADELRLKRVWKWEGRGPRNPRNPAVVAEWWIFWRRLASGLRSGHQRGLYQALLKELCPKGGYANKVKAGPQAKAEMWRCLGALELAPVDFKRSVGDTLAARAGKLESYEYWVLARLGARRLFRAPANHVLPPDTAECWLTALLAAPVAASLENHRLFMVSRLADLTGDRGTDLSPVARRTALDVLRKGGAPEHWIRAVETVETDTPEEQARVLGDSLPLGLRVAPV